jgi:hypothetical protein
MFEPGTQVGRYEIQRRLGRGGMGSVYGAHDPVLGRMVAIKVFDGDLDLPDARERFSREARAAATLSHPNIVTIYDFGEHESQPYIVMEYVAGETLAGFIRRKTPVTMADKVRWMEELCVGVGYAHQMQLVHRDIKPANVIIDRSGRLKVLDFGIARMLGLASNTAVMVGTPGYMAPEQITGDPVDHRADQFSIGVVFYELLSYTEAFAGDTLPMITHRILHEEPVPLSRLVPDVAQELIAIIQQTLRKNPIDRFSDTESLRSAIARFRREGSNHAWNTSAIPASRETPSPRPGVRGTGSARRRQDDKVGVAELTPPPEPRRGDREVLARRRTMQLEAALQDARALFADGQLELAMDACQQALTLDEDHVGALRLEEEIEIAFRRRATPLAEATPSAQAETSWTDLGVRPSEIATRIDQVAPVGAPPAPSGSMERAALDLPTVPPDVTVRAPARETPAPLPVMAPVPAPASLPGAAVKKDSPAESRNLRLISLVGIAVAAVAVAAVVGVILRGPAPTGTLVIDAMPWGTIKSIESEGGEPVTLPDSPSTPFSITLPSGSYQVVVAGPAPDQQPQRISVRVEPGVANMAPAIRFRVLTPEEYFEEYLAGTSPSPSQTGAPVEPVASPAQSSPVASPASAGNP